ncbi:hypothetical protein MBLNU230_g6925t1 [Neophaeotheca triangularis]
MAALDQQVNWTVSMAQNLDKTLSSKRGKDEVLGNGTRGGPLDDFPGVLRRSLDNTMPPFDVPDEIILEVMEFLWHGANRVLDVQGILASCCRVSDQWRRVAMPFLYYKPHLYGHNFDLFVRTMCPSINHRVRKSPLEGLVKILDMSNLVHQGGKVMTARLLGRVKSSLEEFTAPVATFGINCLPALSKAVNMTMLDLTLVSECPPMISLFNSVERLNNLRTLRLPRSSGFGTSTDRGGVMLNSPRIGWPRNLTDLTISGGLDWNYYNGTISFPSTLGHLSLEHCPRATGNAVWSTIEWAHINSNSLTSLKLRSLPRTASDEFDWLLVRFPTLLRLSVSVDYISPSFFDKRAEVPQGYAIQFIELTDSGTPGNDEKVEPLDVIMGQDEGAFPALRAITVATTLRWDSSTGTGAESQALHERFEELAKEDWEAKTGLFRDMEDKEYRKGWKVINPGVFIRGAAETRRG